MINVTVNLSCIVFSEIAGSWACFQKKITNLAGVNSVVRINGHVFIMNASCRRKFLYLLYRKIDLTWKFRSDEI